MTADRRPRASRAGGPRVPHPHRRGRRAAHRRRGRGHLRRARRPARGLRLRGRAVAHPAPDRSTASSTAAPTRSARRSATRPRVGVREIPDGLFSSLAGARGARPATQIEVQTPTGSFRADPADGRAGTCASPPAPGITPMLSIAAHRAARTRTPTVTLLYGNRTTGSVMFAEELADLKNRYGPRLRARARAVPRAPRRRAVLRPPRRRPAAPAARARWCRSRASTTCGCAGRSA